MSNPTAIRAEDVQKVHASVKKASDLIDSGETPNDAFLAVAREDKLTPGFLKSACVAFNTGKTRLQWVKEANLLDKLKSFPLADFEKIAAQIWGKKVAEKTASPELSLRIPNKDSVLQAVREEKTAAMALWSPQGEKVAEADEESEESCCIDDVDYFGLAKIKEAAQREYETVRRNAAEARDLLRASHDKLAKYFQRPQSERAALRQAKTAAVAYFGETVARAFDTIEEGQGSATWAKEGSFNPTATLGRDSEPVQLAVQMSKIAEICNGLTEHLEHWEEVVATATEKAAGCGQPKPKKKTAPAKSLLGGTFEKEAGVFDDMRQDFQVGHQTGQEFGTAAQQGYDSTRKAVSGWRNSRDQALTGSLLSQQDQLDKELDQQTGRQQSEQIRQLQRERRMATLTDGGMGRRSISQNIMNPLMGKGPAPIVGDVGAGSEANMRNAINNRLDDPVHRRALSKIRIQSALTRAMTDPRSSLSGRDPEDVIMAYNELAESYPHVVQNPVALPSVLSRYMAEQMDMHEVQGLESSEKSMRDRSPKPREKETEQLKAQGDELRGSLRQNRIRRSVSDSPTPAAKSEEPNTDTFDIEDDATPQDTQATPQREPQQGAVGLPAPPVPDVKRLGRVLIPPYSEVESEEPSVTVREPDTAGAGLSPRRPEEAYKAISEQYGADHPIAKALQLRLERGGGKGYPAKKQKKQKQSS